MPISPVAVAGIDFAPEAVADIKALADLIALDCGQERADRFILRLNRRIPALEVFPRAGRRLAGAGRGVKLIGFGRRVTILFRRARHDVLILRVLYAGRQP